jgi:threonylcarbamoyladenosine tRNA methylthiotransferase MtaB
VLCRHLGSLVGTRQRVLVEREGVGRTEGFAPVAIGEGGPGEIVEVVVASHDGERLVAASQAARAA